MDFKKLMKKYQSEMEKNLIRFVNINSEYDACTVTKTTPFGKGVDDALKFIGKLAEDDGFKVDYCDGYATEITIGSGNKVIGIFGHADVVPATGEWTYEPYSGTKVGDNIFGRGTTDDKGPVIAAYYAAKALFDNNLIGDNYKILLVVGGDEERGSGCLDYYFGVLKKPYPDLGFTPDADFPVIYGEKGIVNFDLIKGIELDSIESISGGIVYNAVCDYAEIKTSSEEVKSYFKNNVKEAKIDGDLICVKGISAHGSTPHLGKNAALIALKALGDVLDNAYLKEISEKLSDFSGKKFDGFYTSKDLHDTTYNIGVISFKDNKLTLGINFRYPENCILVNAINKVKENLNAEINLGEPSEPLLNDPNSYLVKTLTNAYKEITNDDTPPFTIGGGTYAKHAKNIVAFGGQFSYSVDRMHQPDEFMDVNNLNLMSVIYCKAVYDLGKNK